MRADLFSFSVLLLQEITVMIVWWSGGDISLTSLVLGNAFVVTSTKG